MKETSGNSTAKHARRGNRVSLGWREPGRERAGAAGQSLRTRAWPGSPGGFGSAELPVYSSDSSSRARPPWRAMDLRAHRDRARHLQHSSRSAEAPHTQRRPARPVDRTHPTDSPPPFVVITVSPPILLAAVTALHGYLYLQA